MYKENPKTKGSGIVAAIPHAGRCPCECDECFFQSGRSYLEPLDGNTPNMPLKRQIIGRIVRVNDGHDSNIQKDLVMRAVEDYPAKFFNTSLNLDLDKFFDPVVLTVNPGGATDSIFHQVNPIPRNLMMVRVRVNTWNLDLVDEAVEYYSSRNVPVILTFMAYYSDSKIPYVHESNYIFRKRTLNSYHAITTAAWKEIMKRYVENIWVYSCGKIEGEKGNTKCRFCGNCIREYFATMERIRGGLDG